MATPTYTVEPEAQTADNPQSPFDWDVPDLSLNGNNAATFGGMQNCQRQGDLISFIGTTSLRFRLLTN